MKYINLLLLRYAPARRKGGNKRCFCMSVRPPVRLSVCPSVAYIANNWRTQRPSVPKFGVKVPHLRSDSHTSFKIKRSKIKVTGPINAYTHPAAYRPNANLPHIAGCCSLVYFCAISVSIYTKLARSILMRDRNIATEPNFRKSLSKSRILSPKNLFVNSRRIGATLLLQRSIDSGDVSPHTLTSTFNSP